MTVGQYTQVSMMLNSYGVQLDDDLELDPDLKEPTKPGLSLSKHECHPSISDKDDVKRRHYNPACTTQS